MAIAPKNGQPETYKVLDSPEEGQPNRTTNGQPETYRIFDSMEQPPVVDPVEQERDTQFHSVLIGQPVEAIRSDVQSGANVQYDANAKATTETNRTNLVNNFVEDRAPSEELKLLQNELQAMDNVGRFASPALVAMLTSPNEGQRDYAVQRIQRVVGAQKMIQERLGSASEGNVVGDFLDFVGTSPINAFMVKRQVELADKATALMRTAISEEEFEVQFGSILDEMSDQGFFTDENRFYIADFAELFGAGTESELAQTQRAWALFDTAATFVGVPVISGGTKIVKGTAKGAVALTKGSANVLRGTTSLTGAMSTGLGTAMSALGSPARMIGWRTNNPALVKKSLDEARLIDDPSTATGLHNATSPSIMTSDTIRPERWAHTSSAAVRAFETESKVLSETKTIMGRAGSSIDDSRLAALETKLSADAKAAAEATGNKRYLDSHIFRDDLDNVVFAEVHGTNKGASFVGPNGLTAAKNLADNIGGEVVEWQNKGHYVVVQAQNVPTEAVGATLRDFGVFSATPTSQLADGFVARYLGSPATQTSDANRAALLTGESVSEVWSKTASARIKEVTKLNSRAEVNEVDGMFEMLRDGKFANQRESYTLQGFRNEFKAKYGKEAKDAQVALYARVQEARDVEAFIQADVFFKKQVTDGVVVMDNQYRVVPLRSADVPDSAMIYDSKSGKMISRDQLPPEQTVLRNYDPDQNMYGTQAMFITGDDIVTRKLYHSDILARNSGGTRMYKNGEINFWVKQNRNKIMADGSTHKVAPLTAMGVRTVDEAQAAISQLNKIIDDLGVRLGSKYNNTAVATLRGNAKADAVVAAHSAWNPSVHNVDQLLKWADESGVDLSKKFDFVRHGENIIDEDVAGGFGGMTLERSMDMRTLNPQSRRNSVLMGYGGKQNRVLSPLEAMQKSSTEMIANQSFRAYAARSINGLLKSAIRNNVLENAAELQGLTLRQKLAKAKIRDIKGEGSKLALEQQKILARLDRGGLGDAQWNSFMGGIGDYLYGKGFQKSANWAADMASTNPLTALRGFTFDAKLGMFNPAQLYVQASQAINIVGVGGLKGVQGSVLYGPVRFALHNGDPAVIKKLGEVVGRAGGITGDQFVDMVGMFKDYGRSTIGVSLAEFGSDAATASSILGKGVGKVRETGRVFFNEGELVARTSAWNTAYLEYVSQFPTRVPRSQHGVKWIMNRQDTLTQSMSGVSRIGFDKLPFAQFLSYSFRINEALFAGTMGGKSVLTTPEKLRLAATHTVVMGASGWGVANTAMEYYNYRFGNDLSEENYTLLKRGAMDYLLTEMSGTKTNLSSRLGSGDNIFMMMKDMAENNIFTTLGGPSLEVGGEALGVLLGGAKSMAKGVTTGDFSDLGESLGRFGRTFSTGNQAYNAYMAFKVGQYLTKDNALLDDKLTDMEGIFIALGVPLEAHSAAFSYGNMAKVEKLFLGSTVNKVQKEWNNVNSMLQRGDYDGAQQTIQNISLLYHSLSPHEQLIIDTEVRRSGGTIVDNLSLRIVQHDLARDINKEE